MRRTLLVVAMSSAALAATALAAQRGDTRDFLDPGSQLEDRFAAGDAAIAYAAVAEALAEYEKAARLAACWGEDRAYATDPVDLYVQSALAEAVIQRLIEATRNVRIERDEYAAEPLLTLRQVDTETLDHTRQLFRVLIVDAWTIYDGHGRRAEAVERVAAAARLCEQLAHTSTPLSCYRSVGAARMLNSAASTLLDEMEERPRGELEAMVLAGALDRLDHDDPTGFADAVRRQTEVRHQWVLEQLRRDDAAEAIASKLNEWGFDVERSVRIDRVAAQWPQAREDPEVQRWLDDAEDADALIEEIEQTKRMMELNVHSPRDAASIRRHMDRFGAVLVQRPHPLATRSNDEVRALAEAAYAEAMRAVELITEADGEGGLEVLRQSMLEDETHLKRWYIGEATLFGNLGCEIGAAVRETRQRARALLKRIAPDREP